MTDRQTTHTKFLHEGSPARLRMLASNLATIGDCFSGTTDAAGVEAKIDESIWMIEQAMPGGEPDVLEDLVEVRRALAEWRRERRALASDPLARLVARVKARASSERLEWVAALLEATE